MNIGLRQFPSPRHGGFGRRLLPLAFFALAMAGSWAPLAQAARDKCPAPPRVEPSTKVLEAALRTRLADRGIRHFLNLSSAPGGSLYAYLFVVAPTMPSQPVEVYLSELVDDLRRRVLQRFDRRLDFATGSFFQFLHKPELETEDTKEWIFSQLGNEIIESYVASWQKIRHLRIEKPSPSTAKITCVVLGEGIGEKDASRRGVELLARLRSIVAKSFPTLALHEESFVHVLPASPAHPGPPVSPVVRPPSSALPLPSQAPSKEAVSRLRAQLEGKLGRTIDARLAALDAKRVSKDGNEPIGPAITALRKEIDGRLLRVETRVRNVDRLHSAASINRVRLDEMQRRLLHLADFAMKLSKRLEKRSASIDGSSSPFKARDDEKPSSSQGEGLVNLGELSPKITPPAKSLIEKSTPVHSPREKSSPKPVRVKRKVEASPSAGAISRLERAVSRLGPSAVDRFRRGRHATVKTRRSRRRRRLPRLGRRKRRRRRPRLSNRTQQGPQGPSLPPIGSSMEPVRAGADVVAPSREQSEEEARLRRLRDAINSL